MFACKKCNLESTNSLNTHYFTEHIRGFMIITDNGSNIMFARIGRGKFSCPTCFKVCHAFDEITEHLFCESETEEHENLEITEVINERKTRKEFNNQNNRLSDFYCNEEKYEFICTNPSKLLCENPSTEVTLVNSFSYSSASLDSFTDKFGSVTLINEQISKSPYHDNEFNYFENNGHINVLNFNQNLPSRNSVDLILDSLMVKSELHKENQSEENLKGTYVQKYCFTYINVLLPLSLGCDGDTNMLLRADKSDILGIPFIPSIPNQQEVIKEQFFVPDFNDMLLRTGKIKKSRSTTAMIGPLTCPRQKELHGILSKYIISPVMCFKILTILDSLPIDDFIPLSKLMLMINTKDRPSIEQRLNMIHELENDNLFQKINGKRNQILLKKGIIYFN